MDELVRSSYVEIRRLCASLVDEASAADLVQETFVRIVRQLPRFRAQSSARTWMFTIAHGVCMDELRARTRSRGRDREQLNMAGAYGADPADAVSVMDCIARLDPGRRTAFVLTQLFGLSYGEVAGLEGCAPGTVASRVARARHELIAALGLSGDDLATGSGPAGRAARADD